MTISNYTQGTNRRRLVAFVAAVFLGFAASVSADEPTFDKFGHPMHGGDYEVFDPSVFDHPNDISNEWMPMKPGTMWVWEGSTTEEGETLEHRIVFAVTDLTKVIDGIRTTVVWIEDISAGEVVEKEIAFFAQANDGTVWYFGEYPEAYEDGKLVEAPTWISGVAEARAGIAMPADPKVGSPSYAQGWAPAIKWTDRAQVAKMGVETCVPVDCYKDVMIMDEYSRDEPGFKLKYYARGVGEVRVGWRGAVEGKETLELVELVQLDAKGLGAIRDKALALEKNAYNTSKDVYGKTEPMERLAQN